MRKNRLLLFAVLVSSTAVARNASAEPLQVSWLTQYCNEAIRTTDLATQPRMLRNISNSLMTAAPSYLDDSIYLQRRTNFTDLCPELNGIGETAQEWLRPNRVSLSKPAVVVAAVREDHYPGAGALLNGLGWTSLGDTVTLNYVAGVAQLSLYAGLVPAGGVSISGAGVDALRQGGHPNTSPHYFFFQEGAAFTPETLASLHVVGVPEPGSAALFALVVALPLVLAYSRRRRYTMARPAAGAY